MTKQQYSIIYFVIILLFIPGLFSLLRPDLSGDTRIEFRPLNDLPVYPATFDDLMSWSNKFDDYVNDRFIYRSALINIVGITYYYFGSTISEQVIVGTGQWLFLKDQSNVLMETRGIRTFSTRDSSLWIKNYINWQLYFSKRNIRLVMVIIPNKHTIYNDKLPEHYFKIAPTIRETLVDESIRQGVHDFIDLSKEIKAKAKDRKLYNYRDTHWNDDGGLVALNIIMRELGLHDVNHMEDAMYSSQKYNGDLARLAGMRDLQETRHVITFKKGINNNFDQLDGEHTLKNGKVLVLGDSFYKSVLEKHFLKIFDEVSYRHHGSIKFPFDMIADKKPDTILLLVAERLIPYSLPSP